MAARREAEEQEERRRQLQEFLAAKGKKLGKPQRPGGGRGAGGGRPCLQDRTNPQKAAPPKADPKVARKSFAPGRASKGQSRALAAPIPGAREPRAKASVPSSALLPGRRLGFPVPAGTQKKGPGSHPVGSKAPRTTRSVATGGQRSSLTRHQTEREGEKENRKATAVPPHENKRRTPGWASRIAASQGLPVEKNHRAVGSFTPGSCQSRIKWLAEAPARGRPRDLPGGCQGTSVARPPLCPVWSSTVSRPSSQSQGPNPRVEKTSRPALVTPRDHKAQHASHRRAPQPETKKCPTEQAEGKRKALQRAPQEGRLGAWGGIARKRSPGQSSKSKKSALGARARPTAAHHHPVPAEAGALPQSKQLPNERPLTPSPQDRRKLLAEWLASRGKCYKRPPMTLLAQKVKRTPKEKASLNLSFWRQLEEEKEEAGQCLALAGEIDSTLTDCLRLAEEGIPSSELLATLSRIPEAERFAQFWLCKAKLLAREGPFDVAGLYQAAVDASAVPQEGLLEKMAEISKDARKMLSVPPVVPTPASLPSGITEVRNPGLVSDPVSAIKIQVAPLFTAKEGSARPDVVLLTPVRRSRRIERVSAGYPEMLKDHHWVVASLEEISTSKRKSQFVFRKNEALMEEVDLGGLVRGGLFSLEEG